MVHRGSVHRAPYNLQFIESDAKLTFILFLDFGSGHIVEVCRECLGFASDRERTVQNTK